MKTHVVVYNVEMVEVTGGRFWAPYRSEPAAPEPGAEKLSVPGIDPNAFRMRAPVDLHDRRLRSLAAALGPAHMRVSGTWANSTYFHDSDDPAPASPPPGFGGRRGKWRFRREASRSWRSRTRGALAAGDRVIADAALLTLRAEGTAERFAWGSAPLRIAAPITARGFGPSSLTSATERASRRLSCTALLWRLTRPA
jgi:hypothetical protein